MSYLRYNPKELTEELSSYRIPKEEKNRYANYVSALGYKYMYPKECAVYFLNIFVNLYKSKKKFSLYENIGNRAANFKFFLDIESDTDLPSTESIVEEVVKTLQEYTPTKLDREYISFVNDSQPNKRRHIVFQKIIVEGEIYRSLIQKLGNKFPYIDKAVYGLRLPFSHKTTKELTKSTGASGGSADGRSIIDVDSGVYIPEIKERELDAMIKGTIFGAIGALSFQKVIEKAPIDLPEITTKEQTDIIKKISKHKIITDNFKIEIGEKYILLKRIKPSHCLLCERVHERTSQYVVRGGKNLYLKCFRAGKDVRVKVD